MSLVRRSSLILACVLLPTPCLPAAPRPNVLWIMSDDLRPQLGCYGDELVQTPCLDRFSTRALRFERAYIQCAICSPSRNSMLSGLRPNTTGLRGFGVHLRDAVPDVTTLPQHFKNHGYHTQAFGKIFHIYAESMLGSEDDPASWSEPLRLPSVPVWGPEQNALRQRLIAHARAEGKEFNHPHDWPRAETWDDSDVPDDQMQDGELAAMAEAFLKSRAGAEQPFFLAVGFLRPHLPFNAPRKYWRLYDPQELPLPAFRTRPKGAPPWSVTQGIVRNYHNMPAPEEIDEAFLRRYLQAYLACISYMDACFGRLMTALENAGLADNTIVVFIGDHGYQMGEYDSWGHKHSNFEISTRTPLLVRAPGMHAGGRGSRQLVEFLDLYPTLCELAGLPPPQHLEGKSFARLLDDPEAPHRNAAYSEMQRGRRLGRTIRTANHRYTEWRDGAGRLVARELYVHRPDDTDHLLEVANVADDPALEPIVRDLARRLNDQLPRNPER
ncbi:MAG: sulfatase [Planctomycetes bacterium]|nr:sulfatase [Planctomycetota bacterium]